MRTRGVVALSRGAWAALALLFVACASSDPNDGEVLDGSGGSPSAPSGGGMPASGGTSAGGATSAGGMGTSTGAASTGGRAAGGTLGAGGSGAGGAPTGGSSSGSSGGQPATGGANNGGGGTGGASSQIFAPCPLEGPCKVLPLGDSITVGVGSESAGGGGYRVELFRLAVEGGYSMTFTGAQMENGPMMVSSEPFPRKHGGISGQVIDEISERIPNPELAEMPHIILVHAGTNDLTFSPQGAEQRFEPFLDELIEEAPDALLVIGGIIPMSFYDVTPYNAAIEALVQERADEGAHLLFVDHFEGFPMGELGDQVHPNVAGYARMAAKWFESIEPYLTPR